MIDPQIPIQLGKELDRLRTENAEQRRWFEGQREVVRLLKEENERLRAENATLREELRKRAKQIGVACMKHDLTHSLACGHCHEELRELVREVIDYYPSGSDPDWRERAEKATKQKEGPEGP